MLLAINTLDYIRPMAVSGVIAVIASAFFAVATMVQLFTGKISRPRLIACSAAAAGIALLGVLLVSIAASISSAV